MLESPHTSFRDALSGIIDMTALAGAYPVPPWRAIRARLRVFRCRVSRDRCSRMSGRDVGHTGCQVRNLWTSAVRQAALQIRTGFPSQVGAGVTMSR